MRIRAIAAALGLALGLGTVPAAPSAAADLDLGPLRGSYGSSGLVPVVRWQGGYFGGTAGSSLLRSNGGGSVERLIARALRDTRVEAEMEVSTWLRPQMRDAREATYGVFAGYNFQFAETVLGIEADMTFGSVSASGSDTLSRQTRLSNGYRARSTATGTEAVELKNWATLRARAGYTLGAFMPYVTGTLLTISTGNDGADLQHDGDARAGRCAGHERHDAPRLHARGDVRSDHPAAGCARATRRATRPPITTGCPARRRSPSRSTT